MKYLIIIITLYFYTNLFCQNEKYWQLPDSLQKIFAKQDLDDYGIIFVDSILYCHLDKFYRLKTNTLKDKKPDPGYFGVRGLLVDGDMKSGVFKTRTRSSHADTYIFTFSKNEFKIYDGNYSNKEITEIIKVFLNNNQYLFSGLNKKKQKKTLFKQIRKINKANQNKR